MANLINKAKESAEENSGSADFEEELDEQFDWHGIDVDSDVEYVRTQPTVQLDATFPDEEEGNPLQRNPQPEHYDDRYDQGYLMIVVDDVEVSVDGEEDVVILYREESNEYRVFDLNDRGTDRVGEGKIAFNNGVSETLYRGEEVDEIPDGRIRYTVTSGAAKNVARRLDVCGAEDADTTEDGVNNGLIEKVPPWASDDNGEDEDGYYSRYARDPELREDLRGERVSFVHGRGDEMRGDDSGGYHFVVFDGDGEEVEPTDEGEPTVRRERDDDDDWLNRTFLRSEWGRWERAHSGDDSSGGLPTQQEKFVEEYVAADMDADEDSIRSHLQDNNDKFENDVQADRIVQEIQQAT